MRLVRKLLVAVAAAVGVVALLLVAGGWYFSSVALTVDHATYYELPVLAADDADVTLRYEREVTFPGVYDIPWDGGRAVLGNVLEVAPPDGDDAGSVRRALVRVSEGDLADAAEVAWGYQVYTGDPKTALGLEFTEVTYPSPVGDMPAWLVPAADPDPTTPWVVAVHGINGSRQDFLRMLPALHEAGYPVLVLAYRNDREAPPAPDGLHHLGDTEWEDVDAALGWARDQGAGSFVLMGQSMGGAIVLQAADRSEHADSVTGLVLDSPVIDWHDVFFSQGLDRGVPPMLGPALLWVTEQILRIRIGFDIARFDWLARADDLDVPALIVHGPDDDYVPWGPATELATARPDAVTLVPFDQAGHTRNFNSDPQRWTDAVTGFFTEARSR
jgi:dienelactone hydrolase